MVAPRSPNVRNQGRFLKRSFQSVVAPELSDEDTELIVSTKDLQWIGSTEPRNERLQQNEYIRSVPEGARVERGNVDAWNCGDCHLVHHEIWRNLHECCYYPTYSTQRLKTRNTDDSHVWLRKFFHLIVIGDEPLPFLRERADRIALPHAVVVGKER